MPDPLQVQWALLVRNLAVCIQCIQQDSTYAFSAVQACASATEDFFGCGDQPQYEPRVQHYRLYRVEARTGGGFCSFSAGAARFP